MTGGLRRGLPALGAAASLTAIFVAVLSIPLSTASQLGLSDGETVGWIMALYGVPSLLTIALVARYRQPLLVTGNVFVLIFVASLGTDLTWPELVGASVVAGAVVLVIGLVGFVDRLSDLLPPPIVFGLLAGAVLHFFVDLFSAVGDEPLVVGLTLLAFLAGRRFTEPRIPAILLALVTGIVLAALTGDLGGVPREMVLPSPTLTAPDFSLAAIATATPVLVVLVTLQANVPSLVFLREHGYEPPESTVSTMSGVGMTAGSLLGPLGVSLSLPATALCAGPDAGDHDVRYWSAVLAGSTGLAIALLAGVATDVAAAVPPTLLAAIVGLAVLGILATALRQVTAGPLTWGPLFAFAISQSELELASLGPFFWALVGGLGVSLVLEREEWRSLRQR